MYNSEVKYYNYDQVFIIPEYSDITTRMEVDTSIKLGDLTLQVGIIASNMDTISESRMCSTLWRAGAIGALHRFMPIGSNAEEYLKVRESNAECFVSVGVNGDWEERAKALYDVGARYFIIDIAHGHSKMMKDTVKTFRKLLPASDVFIMGGNITTPESVSDLENWGVDACKLGLAGGFVCLTKDVTGVIVPMFTAIQQCSAVAKKPIIADGGARSYADICKAIGAGATAVMSGWFFAGTDEVPETAKQKNHTDGSEHFIYRGSASKDVMSKTRSVNLPTAEGKSIEVSYKGSAVNIIKDIAGGLRSSYSYVGASNTETFQAKVKFGIKG